MKEIILRHQKECEYLSSLPYQARHVQYPIEDLLQTNVIKLITGPRRAGKSVFCLQILSGKKFAYLNFDDETLVEQFDEREVETALSVVYQDYEYLLLDEIQNLPQWESWVGKLYRRGFNLVLTGSNSALLSGELASRLTGRFIPIEIFPFSLQEALAYKQINRDDPIQYSIAIDEYLTHGGYPEIQKAPAVAQGYLSSLFEAIINKDIVRRFNIRKVRELNTIATYMLSNFTNLFTARDLADVLGIGSPTTTIKLVDYLSLPYLFFYLPRYNHKLQLMKKAARKIYVVDNGYLLAKAFQTSDNYGRLLENQVLTDLLRKGKKIESDLFYYRTRNDKEVDFVVRSSNHVDTLIQVCYDLTSLKVQKREISALYEAQDELHAEHLVIITQSQVSALEIPKGKYPISVLSYADWNSFAM